MSSSRVLMLPAKPFCVLWLLQLGLIVAAEQGRTSPEYLAIHLALGDALLSTSLQDAVDTYVEVSRYLLSERAAWR